MPPLLMIDAAVKLPVILAVPVTSKLYAGDELPTPNLSTPSKYNPLTLVMTVAPFENITCPPVVAAAVVTVPTLNVLFALRSKDVPLMVRVREVGVYVVESNDPSPFKNCADVPLAMYF